MAGDKKGVPVPGLAALRKRAGLSQEDLARQSGVGIATISRIERGANAYYDTIEKLARALKISRRRLLSEPAPIQDSLEQLADGLAE
ncbi:MAG TPA: helix-turn-helix transcriptional regulator [Ktedonobacteraceae bacterium]|nr:helix-turn-helix transcriptional regulator [Ktedonobacteraceae bacterium]